MVSLLHAGGTIVERELNNEALLIDTGCIVALLGLDYDIQRAGNLKSMFFGERPVLAKIQGTGKCIYKVYPFRAWPIASFNMPQRLGERLKGKVYIRGIGSFYRRG